jgi:hypothetical protein
VHLRRALLLFAIVLGLAALAASISRPRDDGERSSGQRTTQADAQPQPRAPESTLRLDAWRPANRRLPAGTAVEVGVAVREPGLVAIPRLGLSAPATPVTPARFDVLVQESGRYPIVFTPADGDESRLAGALVITSPGG